MPSEVARALKVKVSQIQVQLDRLERDKHILLKNQNGTYQLAYGELEKFNLTEIIPRAVRNLILVIVSCISGIALGIGLTMKSDNISGVYFLIICSIILLIIVAFWAAFDR